MQELSFSNLAYLEEEYQKYLQDPALVEPSWRGFFEGWEFAKNTQEPVESASGSVEDLVEAYRTYGHLKARFNCLESEAPSQVAELAYQTYGLKEGDLDKIYSSSFPSQGKTLRDLIEDLEKTYCDGVGIEYMGIQNPELKKWIQKEVEPGFPVNFTSSQQLDILHDLNRAELFETFLHTKYVGQKRFSLEGGEVLIPMLKMILEKAATDGVHEIILGMAHRGRLNVLANILNKSYEEIFREFEDYYTPEFIQGTGDVKYHKGFSGSLKTNNGEEIKVILSANPSHLEAVDPVVEGQTRGRQQALGRKEVAPILIHGDASIAGQGVVYETLQLGQLSGYSTGGTVHIVINNQIGFTTLPKDGRSTRYCTDIARSFDAPVFHVNGEDPEACVYVALLALKIRQTFHIDVFIDVNCYRKYGHNEGDEPFFTQPLQYTQIGQKTAVRKLYLEKLISSGVLNQETFARSEKQFRDALQKAVAELSSTPPSEKKKEGSSPTASLPAVSLETLQGFARQFCAVPQGFNLHPKVLKLHEERLAMTLDPESRKVDWGMGELLAYASLLAEGVHVRISGQDSQRGTFSHRHAVWVDQKTENHYFPLSHLSTNKAAFDIYNSPLSEFAVLGFEFGYSLGLTQALVIWEAQFGDFGNGAQVIIDQFIASSEQKWGTRSRIALFLPHGYEGQGPEHSSARLERFLQLSADNNWYVVHCTEPVQLFHLLRRQAKELNPCPLILMTPKKLLRHPDCLSQLKEFTSGGFQEILPETLVFEPRRVIFCSGKVYYDLLAAREERSQRAKKTPDVALVRIEQLYPLEIQKLKNVVQKYQGIKNVEWCWLQEESQNMGAWSYIEPLLEAALQRRVRYLGRSPSSAPATGLHTLHQKQLDQLIQEAFG